MRITSFVLLLVPAMLVEAIVPVMLAADEFPQTSVAVAVGEQLAGVRDNSEGHLDTAESHYRNAIAIWDQMAPAQLIAPSPSRSRSSRSPRMSSHP